MASVAAAQPITSIVNTRFAEHAGDKSWLTNLMNDIGYFMNMFKGALASSVTAWTPGQISNNSKVSTTVTVTGCALGDFVMASYDAAQNGALQLTGYVSAGGTVTCVFTNNTGGAITPTAGNLRVMVFPAANIHTLLMGGAPTPIATT